MKLPVFISLTTISSRLNTLDQVLENLIQQTLKADRILLNISVGPFMLDKGITFKELPPQTRKWINSGEVEANYCENTGPYRKILPTLERFKNSEFLVVTADDDTLYPKEWLQNLLEVSVGHNCIAAYRCRLMLSTDHILGPYNQWPVVNSATFAEKGFDPNTPSLRLHPTGRDGIIYHSDFLDDIEALRALKDILPGQDDIALKLVSLMKGVPVMIADRRKTSLKAGFHFPGIDVAEGTELWSSNAAGQNDVALSRALQWCEAHRNFRLTNLPEIFS